jgi:hypothetical protein
MATESVLGTYLIHAVVTVAVHQSTVCSCIGDAAGCSQLNPDAFSFFEVPQSAVHVDQGTETYKVRREASGFELVENLHSFADTASFAGSVKQYVVSPKIRSATCLLHAFQEISRVPPPTPLAVSIEHCIVSYLHKSPKTFI